MNTIRILILYYVQRVTLQKLTNRQRIERLVSRWFLRAIVSLAEEFLKARLRAGRPAFLTESEGPAQRDALMNGFLRVEPLNSRVTPIPGARVRNAGQISWRTTLAKLPAGNVYGWRKKSAASVGYNEHKGTATQLMKGCRNLEIRNFHDTSTVVAYWKNCNFQTQISWD